MEILRLVLNLQKWDLKCEVLVYNFGFKLTVSLNLESQFTVELCKLLNLKR